MQRFGQIITERLPRWITPNDVLTFLGLALAEVSPEKPFRGPIHYEEGPLRYMCFSEGDSTINLFNGHEIITYKATRIVYKLHFHGSAFSSMLTEP